MSTELKPITITPERIIAAAQKIADSHDDAWEHTPEQYIAATEHWLRIKINELLSEAAHYASKSDISGNFDLELNCESRSRNHHDGLWHRCENPALPHSPFCEMHNYPHWEEAPSATELVMPEPPEWAYDTISAEELPF